MPFCISLKLYFLTILWAFVLSAGAQEVNNKAFDLVLKGLLSDQVEMIDAATLKNQKEVYYILDAREKIEFEVSHLSGAQHIGYDQVNWTLIEGLPKATPIVVYCSVGYRSERIGEALKSKGFSNVKNLYGGIFEWANLNYPLVNASESITNRVHGYDRLWGIWLDENQVDVIYSSSSE